MHVVAFFGLILLISLRTAGLFISIGFLHDLKESKFKILIIGWTFWIMAGTFALLTSITRNQLQFDIFRLLNGITSSIAILFISMGLYNYFQKISKKLLLILSVIFTIVPITAFILGFFSSAFELTTISVSLIALIYTLFPLRKMDTFRNELSLKSLYWYLILIATVYSSTISSITFMIQGYPFGFYSEEFSIPMFINYLFICLTTIIIIVYSIHLEYDISKGQRYRLRDKFSHDLGNLVQVIYSAAILTNVEEDLSKEKAENLDLIQEKCEEAAKLIKDIKETQ
jgi:hypothetical protein